MDNKIKISLICLGCPKNIADMEGIMSELSNIHLSNETESEIVIINTCGFLKSARDEVYEHIERLSNKKIIIIGCLSSWFDNSEQKKYPQIYAVLTSANYKQIENAIEKAHKETKTFLIDKEPEIFDDFKGKTLLFQNQFAYVKIAEGCNNRCSYCMIPFLKGKFRSRKMSSIEKEVKTLVKSGIKEIILVAQDCGYYGIDIYGKRSLSDLLNKLIQIKGDFWIRVLYVYPERITKELISTIKSSDKICKYLDIPLQHGDKDILEKMRRPNDLARTLKLIKNLREEIPEISLRTSFIVGFPGESEKAYLNLEKFIKKINFDLVGVFEYSKEPNTYAYTLPDQIPSSIKKSRRKKLMILQQKISLSNNQKQIGKREKVLIEGHDNEQKIYTGRSQRFAPEIDGNFYVESENKLNIGEFVETEITDANEYDFLSKTLPS